MKEIENKEIDNTTENTEGIIEFTITNTFEVPSETTNIEVTKIWNDNHNRAGKRPESVTLVLTGNSKAYEVTLTKENAIDGATSDGQDTSTTWKGIVENLPKYDENADIINYELSEENLNSIFYTQENTTINQQTKTVTNKFEVPDDKIEIEVHKKWEDNHNELGRRPESVTLYLTGNNQEYEITLNESNKNIVEAKDRDEENLISNEVLQASAIEEKILPTAEFAMKKVYNECGHFKFEYAELPQELVNLTEEELEAYYKDWEIEEFSPSKIILTKEINSLCDEHFIIKLGEKYVQVFHLEPDGNLVVYETTDISREYLPEEDIKKLEEGIYVFGEGKLNSILEDFE